MTMRIAVPGQFGKIVELLKDRGSRIRAAKVIVISNQAKIMLNRSSKLYPVELLIQAGLQLNLYLLVKICAKHAKILHAVRYYIPYYTYNTPHYISCIS